MWLWVVVALWLLLPQPILLSTETLSFLINTPGCILGKMLLDEDPATVCPYYYPLCQS